MRYVTILWDIEASITLTIMLLFKLTRMSKNQMCSYWWAIPGEQLLCGRVLNKKHLWRHGYFSSSCIASFFVQLKILYEVKSSFLFACCWEFGTFLWWIEGALDCFYSCRSSSTSNSQLSEGVTYLE